MSDLPKRVRIREVGPREGFQFEKGAISLADKVSLVDALSDTGVGTIEFTSFVSPKWVPQMADAEQVVAGIRRAPGVAYEAIWLNEAGLERAARLRDVLALRPMFSVAASDTFMRKNTNCSVEERLAELPGWAERYRALGMDWLDVGVMAAFGCNYEGDVEPRRVVTVLQQVEQRAQACGARLGGIGLADTMGWANPLEVKRLVGAVRERWPEARLKLHLHDTRALAIANAVAALELGVDCFDSAVAGMGGCPFAAHKGAAGNVTTEDLVFLCQELGIATGIDLDRMIAAGQLAERVVGHPLPGKLKSGGNLATYRATSRAART
ncbi:MAG: hydroxymethylglutaryl-CoA lyase [Candidatus Rokubacteria bacterium GWA2_73_35]|nr:MAG: hydroxymethylglutaryl-CoA lyase [Candidatus Rokubacteria bacterium GWA2_73_35]